MKQVIESTLTATGGARFARRSRVGQTIVLAYHNIIPEGERASGDASLHLHQRDFAKQLDLLARTHDVIRLTELSTPPRSKPRAVITFDDAYYGALTAGVAELQRRNMPATVFVAPAFVGGGSFWWDALATTDGLAPSTRDDALNKFAGNDAAIRAWAESVGLQLASVPRCQTVAGEAELNLAAATGLITYGSHTWSHPNLALLDQEQVKLQMAQSLEWLRARFSQTIPWISYPYGLRNDSVEKLAAEAGFKGGFLIDGGWITPQHRAAFALPRLNVPSGISLRGFELRVSGLFNR